jgi:hypothetical protein
LCLIFFDQNYHVKLEFAQSPVLDVFNIVFGCRLFFMFIRNKNLHTNFVLSIFVAFVYNVIVESEICRPEKWEEVRN